MNPLLVSVFQHTVVSMGLFACWMFIGFFAWVAFGMPEIAYQVPLVRRWMKPKEPKTPDALVDAIISSFKDEPEKWHNSQHTVTHRVSELELWVGNGVHHMKVYQPDEVDFSAEQRHRIWSAYLEHVRPTNLPGAYAALNKLRNPYS